MMSPEEKYRNDATYRRFVDSVENLLHERHFTRPEIDEMVRCAIAHFEFSKDFKWTPEEILKSEG